ncbi:MAG: sigma-54 interaction domain-containing protein, partial [Desulfotomaculales bacterium]
MLDGARGPTQFFVRVRPIYYGSAYGGAVVMLRESREVRRLVHRMVGARATFTFRDLVGASPSFRAAVEHARLAVRSEAAVLLEGESGAGKELFAQAIHNEGGRARGPFVAVNCGAIPRELIASELFGYVEGAFTGAARGGRPGKFELADGGTLFLDEIGEMPLDMQVVLLRVLQEKKVVRVGGTQMVPVDVRIIAATNKSLLREVEKGNFRRDLFYRLNIFHIKIPPLRERPGDVTLLARYFLAKRIPAGRKLSFHPRTLKVLESYAWPGNVRELENLIERLVHTVKEGTILPEHLPPEIRGSAREARSQPDLATVERQEVLRALGLCAGNVKQAAASLGIARSTLYRKLRAYEIDPGS